MKKTINYIFALLLICVVAGCIKNSTAPNNASSNIPNGNFLGVFTLIHKNPKTSVLDTSSANVTMSMSANTAAYSIGGDTTKIQAGSYGTFNVDGTLITFADATVTKKNKPKHA